MKLALTKMTALILVMALFSAPLAFAETQGMQARDEQVDAAKMVADTVLARPLGLVSTIIGFGVFIVSSPFSALGGNTDEAWNAMVANPARFTFKRPLGDFD